MTATPYRKLTGRRRSLTGYSQLWLREGLGEGHLLLVRSTRLSEHYQRFALQDIQALVISDGPNLLAIQVLAVLISLGWAALALTVTSTFGRSFFLVTGLGGLLAAIVDIARGPRCRCVLHTAVSRELLGPVHRRNASWRFLAQALPAIEAAQGSLSAEQLQSVAAASLTPESAQRQPPEVKRGRNYAAEILGGLLVLDAVLVWVALRTFIPNVAGLLPTVYLAEMVLATVTITQRHAMKTALLVWGTITLVLVISDISTVSGIAAWTALMNSAGIGGINVDTRQALRSLWLSPVATVAVAALGRLVLGAVGLALCYRDRIANREGVAV